MTTGVSTQAQPSAFAVFRNRNFTMLWLAQFVSTLGSGLTTVAASILVFRATGSALSVGLMLLVTTAPGLLVGLVAGVFVDRSDRKRIMVFAELARAVLVLAIPLLIPFGVVWLYVLAAASSTVKQFFDPAQASVLPELASDEELAAANSFMMISIIGAEVLGISLAGLIAANFDLVWAFYIDAFTFLISGLCLLLLRIPPLPQHEDTSLASVGQNLRAGVSFVGESRILRALFGVFVPVFVIFGLMNALNLPFIVETVGAGELAFGLVEGIGLVGFVLGSFLMASYADRLHDSQWVSLSLLGMGIFGSLYALLSSVPLLILVNGAYYFLNALCYIGRQLLIQRGTPRELRGRVSSAFFVTRDSCFMAGMLLAGLGDRFDVRLLLLLCGVGLAISAMLALVLPGMRQSAAEWRRLGALLRRSSTTTGLGRGRVATLADVDALALRLPPIAGLSRAAREQLAEHARVYEVAPAGRVVSQGEASDAAYFLIAGRTVASRSEEGEDRALEVHGPGDFFGEIAALTGVPRTASVVAEQPTTLLEVRAAELRLLVADPQLSRALLSKLTERLARMQLIEIPRFATLDQSALRELRSEPAG